MLFNTYLFIFIFLVPTLLFYNVLPKNAKLRFLILVSILFYAQWSLFHLFILCFSISTNFILAKFISKFKKFKKFILLLSIVLNISLLGYFKYSGFLNLTSENIILPLAISFFTFQQIAYIVDIYRNKIQIESFERYVFFVFFFPQLVAGPIVHYTYIMNQIKENRHLKFNSNYFKAGVVLFCIGLFKKAVIADSLIDNTIINSYDAWIELFSYSFKIYFDFSGYVDMAIGLALMFGIRLPMNFNSPYKSKNLIEFWRRWHITLSTFLKEHIYIPLGGNKSGITIQITSILITMLIGGIWHGAGWNFLVWGGVHGLAISFLHLYSFLFKTKYMFTSIVSVLITFLFVSLTWVLFRESSFVDALSFYKLLFSFDFENIKFDLWKNSLIVLCFILIWLCPNSMQIIDFENKKFSIKLWYGYLAAILLFISLKFMAIVPSLKFVYFNF